MAARLGIPSDPQLRSGLDPRRPRRTPSPLPSCPACSAGWLLQILPTNWCLLRPIQAQPPSASIQSGEFLSGRPLEVEFDGPRRSCPLAATHHDSQWTLFIWPVPHCLLDNLSWALLVQTIVGEVSAPASIWPFVDNRTGHRLGHGAGRGDP